MAAAAGWFLAAGAALASPAGPILPIAPPPPAEPAWVVVTTKPSGLRVRIGDVEAGWSPVAAFRVPSGRVTVRAFPADPRRFVPARDAVTLTAAPHETLHVELDLRPHPLLLSDPSGAGVSIVSWRSERLDSLLGETPIRVAPLTLEGNRLLFSSPGYADSVLPGALLLAMADGGAGAARVELRTLHLPPPARPPGPSLLGRRWFQFALIGVGSALTGSAAVLRREGDRAYDRYLAATNPDVIEHEYDTTIRYDRWAAGSLGAGQVLLTAGLFLIVSGVGR